MKTAMQELREAIDIECKARGIIINWDMYLDKERQQIHNAYISGLNRIHANMTSKEYYNQHYQP